MSVRPRAEDEGPRAGCCSRALESFGLSTVSAHLLGGGAKYDLDPNEMHAMLLRRNVEEWAEIGLYNLRDSASTLRILLVKKQIQFALQLASVTNCTLPQITSGGQQKRLTAMVGREARRRGYVVDHPTKQDFYARPWLSGGGHKVKGAAVLPVAQGWYQDAVVTCDFSSLYPSLLISHNLCPSTLLLDEVQPELSAALNAHKI